MKLLAGICLALFGVVCAAETLPPLRVGIDGGFPPYSELQPDGSLKGFDVDIANAVCASLKRQCQLVRSDFDGMIPALEARKLDMIVASITITEERRRKVEFSDKYEGSHHVLYGKKNTSLQGTPAGMKGRRIGVLRGSVQESYMKAVFVPAGARIASYDDVEKALLDLSIGRLDAIFVESANAEQFKKRPSAAKLAVFGSRFDDPAYFGAGCGIAMRKGESELLKAVNQAIKTLRSSGAYKQINDRYFSYDQYE